MNAKFFDEGLLFSNKAKHLELILDMTIVKEHLEYIVSKGKRGNHTPFIKYIKSW